MTMLNAISTTCAILIIAFRSFTKILVNRAYFMHLARTSAGECLAALQMKRTAEAADAISKMTADQIGEISQFLSMLLLVQGTSIINEGHKKILIPKLKEWRAWGVLFYWQAIWCMSLCSVWGLCAWWFSRKIRPVMRTLKQELESSLTKCGSPICDRTTQDGGADLLRCAR